MEQSSSWEANRSSAS